jgi:hypothetical protein
MRFRDLPREYKMVAVDFLRKIKNQDTHRYCFHKIERRPGSYSSWEQDKNCDVEIWEQEGHCKHGVYVGGCGIDWMCQMCESGVSDYEWAMGFAFERYNRDMRAEAKKEIEAIFEFFGTVDYDTNCAVHKAMIQRATELNITYR